MGAKGHTVEIIADPGVLGATVVKITRVHNSAVLPRAMMLGEFLDLKLPPRVTMLAPIFAEKSINMIFAPRGIGKTYLALSIAYAMGTGGSLLRWQADRARRILIIDGEMPAAALQDRLREIADGQGNRSYADANIGVLARTSLKPDSPTCRPQRVKKPSRRISTATT